MNRISQIFNRNLKSSWIWPPVIDVFKYILVIAAIAWLMLSGTHKLGYNWQWYRVPQYLYAVTDGQFISGPRLDGLLVTFRITAISLILAFCFGLMTALLRLSNSLIGKVLARGSVEIIRNTPLLVQLIFI